MRRIACTLAIFGISFQPILADDPFGQSRFSGSSFSQAAPEESFREAKATPPQSGRSLQFFSASGKETETAKTPEKFTRAQPGANGSPQRPGDELKNYYTELFGNQPATERPEEIATGRSQLQPVKSPPAFHDTGESPSSVVQAEYTQQSGPSESLIQQVVNARPFPGYQTAAMPQSLAQPPQEVHTEQPSEHQSQPDARSGFALAEAPHAAGPHPESPTQLKASLTNPIPVNRTPVIPASSSSNAPKNAFSFASAPSAPAVSPQQTFDPNNTVARKHNSSAQSPAVSVEWVKRSNINVGQECQCELLVKNNGQLPTSAITVEAHFPKNVRLVKSVPVPDQSATFLGWNFAELKPGEEKVIQITMIPLVRGNIETNANVRFSAKANGLFTVAEPLLAVKLDGPGEVMIGEPAAVNVTVNNPGSGIANNVVVEAIVPEGLEHTRGERLLMELGSLNPGESRSVRLALSAVKGGRHRVQVQTRGGSDLVQNTSVEVSVVAPSLITRIDGPGLRYLGRQGKFVLQVGNDGEAASNNVRVMYKIPDGFKFISADRGAEFDATTNLLAWFVGRLEQNQQAQITVLLEATQLGEQTHLVRATTEHGTQKDTQIVTAIEGTSSLSISVVDLDDPVETGSEAIYEIRVKNEGSAPARNVGVACELAAGMHYISAEGPVAHIAENGQVVFRAIPELGSEKSMTFRVRVTSQTAGHARFRAHLSSESVAEPLTAEELTKFYGE